ncbi:aminopeptidase N [Allosphingosinicella deserti]|uniref:Aminopeptidase N n=1 Tax=Allosphingosinicella deserti TaxID=2116704 RepID=A0A2P7QU98_9SPHN|nr:aminopeptidase N [Sphingomonas deserti]PSJ41528.1 aminopeptidase N [Sphingomonas deserti]
MALRFKRTKESAGLLRRDDYRPPEWIVPDSALDIEIFADCFRVRATLDVARAEGSSAPLRLDGEGLRLLGLKIDGRPAAHKLDKTGLTVRIAADRARVETIVEAPLGSEQLGLFAQGGLVCTQCEPQGFRRITFFPDRPDVLSRFRTRITADAARFPILLGNGNADGAGALDGGRHWTAWDDSVPKPCYAFSVVAGDPAARRDRFVTRDGRNVELAIFSEAAEVPRSAHAMAALKAAMAWDEVNYGRVYDLDRYAIVAVPGYRFGAVEAKALNIFDSALLLGHPATSTDGELEAITALVGHEYFHNWSGNRVTIRDWFELALKEGLAVFRDQEFCAALGSPAAKRIQDVKALRAAQFVQDEGPGAHPVRPEQCETIADLYDATVYIKGAEVVRMLRTIAGPQAFGAGLDTFFARHDGTGATCDALIAAVAEHSPDRLETFDRWYANTGTPRITASLRQDGARAILTLVQDGSLPIPIGCALFGPDRKRAEKLVLLEAKRQDFVFEDVPGPLLLSINRTFSAPVQIECERTDTALHALALIDDDPVARWQALQDLAARAILGEAHTAAVIDAIARALDDHAQDPALAAEFAALPAQSRIADGLEAADPGAILRGWRAVQADIGRALAPRWRTFHAADGATGAGVRALRVLALQYLLAADVPDAGALALTDVEGSATLTERYGALRALADSDAAERPAALDLFYRRHRADPALLDKWFCAQALSLRPDTVSAAPRLLTHPDFSLAAPNRLGAIVGGFTANSGAFHHPSGRGYKFVTDVVLASDRIAPAGAARLARPLARWHRIEPVRAALMRAEVARIAGTAGISPELRKAVGAVQPSCIS